MNVLRPLRCLVPSPMRWDSRDLQNHCGIRGANVPEVAGTGGTQTSEKHPITHTGQGPSGQTSHHPQFLQTPCGGKERLGRRLLSPTDAQETPGKGVCDGAPTALAPVGLLSKRFTNGRASHPHKDPMSEVLVSPPFHRGETEAPINTFHTQCTHNMATPSHIHEPHILFHLPTLYRGQTEPWTGVTYGCPRSLGNPAGQKKAVWPRQRARGDTNLGWDSPRAKRVPLPWASFLSLTKSALVSH